MVVITGGIDSRNGLGFTTPIEAGVTSYLEKRLFPPDELGAPGGGGGGTGALGSIGSDCDLVVGTGIAGGGFEGGGGWTPGFDRERICL